MKRRLVRRWAIWGLLPYLAGFAPSAMASTHIPKGTNVPLVFDQALSSKTAKEGDKVNFRVAQDVTVDGKTVIKQGTHVTGIVTSVDKRQRYGVNAKLRIALNPINLGGTTIPLEPKSKGKYTGSRTDQAAIATGGGALLLGPVGLIGGYFVVGKPVNVKVGDPLITEVARDTTF